VISRMEIYKEKDNYRMKYRIAQSRGTQMGLRLSFIILCILHAFAAENRIHGSEYVVFGDDIVARWTSSQYGHYLFNMKSLGFVMNEVKSYQSDRCFTYCGQTFLLNKGFVQVPDIKSLLQPKTGVIDDPILRMRSLNQAERIHCSKREIPIFDAIFRSKFSPEIRNSRRLKVEPFLPEVYGGLGCKPYNCQGARKFRVNVLLKQILKNLPVESRNQAVLRLKACFAPVGSTKEFAEFHFKLNNWLSTKTCRTETVLTSEEVVDSLEAKFMQRESFEVSQGQTKVKVGVRFIDCRNHLYRILYQLSVLCPQNFVDCPPGPWRTKVQWAGSYVKRFTLGVIPEGPKSEYISAQYIAELLELQSVSIEDVESHILGSPMSVVNSKINFWMNEEDQKELDSIVNSCLGLAAIVPKSGWPDLCSSILPPKTGFIKPKVTMSKLLFNDTTPVDSTAKVVKVDTPTLSDRQRKIYKKRFGSTNVITRAKNRNIPKPINPIIERKAQFVVLGKSSMKPQKEVSETKPFADIPEVGFRYTMLNSVYRAFRDQGYTDIESRSLVDGKILPERGVRNI